MRIFSISTHFPTFYFICEGRFIIPPISIHFFFRLQYNPFPMHRRCEKPSEQEKLCVHFFEIERMKWKEKINTKNKNRECVIYISTFSYTVWVCVLLTSTLHNFYIDCANESGAFSLHGETNICKIKYAKIFSVKINSIHKMIVDCVLCMSPHITWERNELKRRFESTDMWESVCERTKRMFSIPFRKYTFSYFLLTFHSLFAQVLAFTLKWLWKLLSKSNCIEEHSAFYVYMRILCTRISRNVLVRSNEKANTNYGNKVQKEQLSFILSNIWCAKHSVFFSPFIIINANITKTKLFEDATWLSLLFSRTFHSAICQQRVKQLWPSALPLENP